MSGDTTESAAAPSTADVASDVIDQLEGSESTPDITGDAPVETPPAESLAEATQVETKADPTPGVIKPAPTREEQLLAEFGFKEAFKPDGREHYIPRSKVLKMIGSGLKRGEEAWHTERTTVTSERDRYKADIEEMYADIKGEPRALLEKLSQVDPRYRALLETPKAAPAPPPDLKLPDPDAEWNGARTWSMEAFQKSVIPYIVEQAKAEARAEAQNTLKPITEREAQAKQREQAEEHIRAAHERVRTLMVDAKQWPGFNEHEAAIFKALQEDSIKAKAENRRPTLSLEAAYRQVVVPRLVEDDTKKRERWAKELNSTAAKTPTVTGAGTDTTRAQKVTTSDIARRIIEQSER